MDQTYQTIALLLDQYSSRLHAQPVSEKQTPAIPIFYQTKTLSSIGHSAKEAIIEEIRRLKNDDILTNEELDMVWDELNACAGKNEEGEKVTIIRLNIGPQLWRFQRPARKANSKIS
jgi:hypothetical protein